MEISKATFCRQYLSTSTEQAMAAALLPDGDRSLESWREAWRRILASPVK